jgi:outer membrane protein OmpA-like peptidoglycan-associated protein
MRRRLSTWLLGALCVLALSATAWAQDVPPAGEGKSTTTTSTTTSSGDTMTHSHGTVEKADVKTWVIDIDGKEWEDHPATPSYEGTTGLFHMATAYTLPKGRFSFSLFRDNLDRSPKDEDISIHGVSLGYGATDRFEIYGNFGLQNRVDADTLFEAGFVNDFPFVSTPWETGVGDVKIGAKYGFLNDYKGDGVGLAIRGLVKIPTADENKGLGTGKVSFGGDLILSKSVDAKLDLHASVGYQVNGDPDGVDIGNAFRWGLGLNVPACTWVQLQAELMGTKYSGGEFEQGKPLDLVVGPVFWIKPGIFIRPALSWNFGFEEPPGIDQSSKSWTGRHIAIGYHPGWGCREIVVPPPPPPPPPSNRAPSAVCEIERSTILPGETVRVRATGSDPDGDPLTYEWSATAGRVTGTGPAVTFDSAGMTPPASSTITVRVSDGRGATAESTCNVRMDAKAAPPQAVSCVSGGFPRNLARLNNVDKACLDDVASRLKSDPRSRVVVVGHADSQEKLPEVIARKRGEAVKEYLVKERGIDEARITVRSAAATKPLDTGTDAAARARNRRVEVWFVPEGASVPED